MAMPLVDVEVCNLAFDLLRHNQKVTNLVTPETEEDSLSARWYDLTRRSVLRAFPWNFARKRAVLTADATAPAFGYTTAYNLPNDFLGIVFIGEDPDVNYESDFLVEGGQILINTTSDLKICYVYDLTQVIKFDPIFVDLLVAELAVRFANSLTGVNKSMKSIEGWRDRCEAKARMQNGRENPPRIRQTSFLIDARRAGMRDASTDGVHLFP